MSDNWESIAVIGMGCRFAGGVNSTESFWELLIEGRDGVSRVPENRWARYLEADPRNVAALRDTTRMGAFVDGIAEFDAGFFGILPREAEQMDPQHRMMLEVTWEALEHAGIPPHRLAGGDTAVYVGIGTEDYGRRLMEDVPQVEAWTGIGSVHCGAANRISYHLDLRGPSMAVDTACSASLTALHLGCRALASGETSLAITGGVNAMLHPAVTKIMDDAGACSPDGRSKAFDASADGYGRGEGAGVLILKRLSDAERDGDRVLAVVRGTGIMQDGRTNGIMQPSARAQADLLRRTYREAGIDPSSVGYVEAHGTGTSVGDPIEASALSEVLGAGRPADRPLLIGSVKTNVGHLEAGAGAAGLIKAVLTLRHGEIPPSLNCTVPNPAIPWDTNGLRVVTEPTPWKPGADGPRRAGVSGYGFGGTIGHVILEAPGTEAADGPARAADGPGGTPAGPWLFPVSAASEEGLRANAARLADWIEGRGRHVALESVGHTLTERRTPLARRAAVIAEDRAGLVASLRGLAAGEEQANVVTGTAAAEPAGAVWVFAGQGAHWIGMGRELLTTSPAFAQVIDQLDPVYRNVLGRTARDILEGDTLEGPEVLQPATYAVQIALAAVWRSHGVEPAAVIGHSIGELAAAVTAGGISLLDAAELACRRALLLRPAAGAGAMALVGLPFAEAGERLADEERVFAAIESSPVSTVIAGEAAAVARICEQWEADGLVVRKVQADIAFHTAEMDPYAAELPGVLAGLRGGRPTTAFYSTSLEDPRAEADLGTDYWTGNLRNPVRFAQAVTAAVEDGHRHFLEISSHPIVSHSIAETLEALGVDDPHVTGTLRRDAPEQRTVLRNLAALHCAGVPADPGARFAASAGLADLPLMAWQHQTYWKDSRPGGRPGVRQHDPETHTLLGGATRIAGSTPLWLWQTYLDMASRPYPGSHPVHDVEIIPAAVLMHTFLEALAQAGADGPGRTRPALVDVALRVPVAVSVPRDIQISYQDSTLRLASRISDEDTPEEEDSWLTHTTASVDPLGGVPESRFDADAVRERCSDVVSPDYLHERVKQIGVAGMGFPWEVEELRRGGPNELFATIDTGAAGTGTWASLLDGAMTVTSVLFLGEPVVRMPSNIARLALLGDPPRRAHVHVRAAERAHTTDTLDVVVADLEGHVVAAVSGIRLTVLTGDPSAAAAPRDLVHEVVWRPLELPAARILKAVVAVGAAPRGLAAACADAGLDFVAVDSPEELAAAGPRLTDTTAVLAFARARPGQGPDVERAAHTAVWSVGRTVQQVLAHAAGRPRVWGVTTGVRESADHAALAQSPVWGLGRITAAEHPDLWGGIIDLDPAAPDGSGSLLQVVRARPEADVISVRGGVHEETRLVPVTGVPRQGSVECRPEGTYLITGGLGALGLETARWLAGRGARRLVLAGRRPFPPRSDWDQRHDPVTRGQIEALRALEGLGVTVTVVSLDITDAEQARKVLSSAELGLPPIRGVVHAAGVVDARMVADLDADSLRAVLRPKVAGSMVLDELFPAGSVDFMVLFSSCGHLFRFPGQGAYGSANAFLDALARHRNATAHDRTISFGWSSWRGLGMSASSEFIAAELAAFGHAEISATEALRSWEHAERFGGGHYAVFRLVPTDGGPRRIPLTAELEAAAGGSDDKAARGPDWTGLSPRELIALLVEEVRGEVAREIKLVPEEIGPQRPLLEMGMDSVMTVAVRRRLERLFGLTLPATLLWNRPTVLAIAEYLAECLVPAGAVEGDA